MGLNELIETQERWRQEVKVKYNVVKVYAEGGLAQHGRKQNVGNSVYLEPVVFHSVSRVLDELV